MALYIDPPTWPAHGTLFSHLISDTSVAELQRFAADAGIAERAFDRDHYDVPQHRYAALVAAGAREVSGNELARVLIRSGLRVRARHRSASLGSVLLDRWNRLLPGHPELGAELLARWSEPHRHYHGRAHLLAVLEALPLLTAAVSQEVELAAWFHDAVYDGVAGQDEERSARLAEDRLVKAGLSSGSAAEVARLVRLTIAHNPAPGDLDGALLCDADLSVLGSSASEYARYVAAVRAEYAAVPDDAFSAGRAAVIRHLLDLEPLFHTPAAQALWLDAARTNLAREAEG